MSDEPAQMLPVIRAADVLTEKVRPVFQAPSVRVIRARVIEELSQIDIAVDAAQAEAKEIIAQAEASAEQIREAAHLEGRTEGTKEMLAALVGARKVYATALDHAEKDMVEMAFRLAGRIIGEAVECAPERLESMVSGVLRRARGKRDIVVLVSPEDLDALTAVSAALERQVDGVHIYFEADATLTRGGCVIQTESGRIDGRIETQLDALQQALRGE